MSDNEKTVEEAKRIIRADYYSNVRSLAKVAVLAIKAGEIGDRYDLDTWLHETCDGSYWVIYTRANLDVMTASDNWLACEEEGLGSVSDGDLSRTLAVYSYYALRADVVQALEAEGVDLNEPEALREAERDESDDKGQEGA